MEYHFTGTGGSPDFTFIADGIIDGTGKVIPYSAVKSTKVKRKGHESILTLETKENGTKTEYCYSVDSKDDKDLRRAVIDIESILLKRAKGEAFTQMEDYRRDGGGSFDMWWRCWMVC